MKEYIVVRNEKNEPVGRREVSSKKLAQNVSGYILNGDLVQSIGEFKKDQELAKNLPDIK